jgi:hypothetical protein
VPYPVLAERWHDFYVVAGTSAATLVGLLFFGLSLHLRLVLSHVEVRGLARVTLANFGFLLFVSLLTVIHQDASAVGPQLIGAGAFSLAVIGPSLVSAVRSRTRTLPSIRLFLRFGLSGLGYMGVILAGVLLVEGDDRAALNLSWVVTVVLLFISLRSSWDLLVTVGEAAMRDES